MADSATTTASRTLLRARSYPNFAANPHSRITTTWNSTTTSFTLNVNAPSGATGRLGVPRFNGMRTLTFDGTKIWDSKTCVGSKTISVGARYVYVTGVAAGQHTLVGSS